MKPEHLQTVARAVRRDLIDFPAVPHLNETPEHFDERRKREHAAVSLARYVAAHHGGGAAFLRACGLRAGT